MMNYRETTEYLFTAMPSFQNVGGEAYKPGLERIEGFCEHLGNPHLSYSTIHIAGTNGKGSTSNMLASVLHSAGYRVGLFTSPHLRDFRERMRVNGEMISESKVVEFVELHRGEMERRGLSFFEMTAAMAFNYFAETQVDIAIVECGLGGRLDATNIVRPMLSVVTNIGLDHTQYLGDTLAKIAAEKGGIIKEGRTVVVGERGDDCDSVFVKIAEERGAKIIFAEDECRAECVEYNPDCQVINTIDKSGKTQQYALDLRGRYQCKNLVTLLSVIDAARGEGVVISEENLKIGLRGVTQSMHLEGRWQRVKMDPPTICDTGHNIHGMREIAKQLQRETYKNLYCVLGFANDKDLRQILSLFPCETKFIFTRPKVERAFTTAEIAAVAEDMGLEFEIVEGVREAVVRGQELADLDDLLFVGGSNFVVAEAI